MPPVQSKIWNQFDIIRDNSQPGKKGDKRKCKYCNKTQAASQLQRAIDHILSCKKVPQPVKLELQTQLKPRNRIRLPVQHSLSPYTVPVFSPSSSVVGSDSDSEISNLSPRPVTQGPIERYIDRTSC